MFRVKEFNDAYFSKLQSDHYKKKDLIFLAQTVKKISQLDEMGRKCYRDISNIVEKIERDQGKHLWQEENASRQLMSIRQSQISFIKGITHHQKTAATHILVYMIICEERRTKPYAIPVQCIPYKGLGDMKICNLANTVIQEMAKRNMKVADTNTLTHTYINCLNNLCLQKVLLLKVNGEHCEQKEIVSRCQYFKFIVKLEQNTHK